VMHAKLLGSIWFDLSPFGFFGKPPLTASSTLCLCQLNFSFFFFLGLSRHRLQLLGASRPWWARPARVELRASVEFVLVLCARPATRRRSSGLAFFGINDICFSRILSLETKKSRRAWPKGMVQAVPAATAVLPPLRRASWTRSAAASLYSSGAAECGALCTSCVATAPHILEDFVRRAVGSLGAELASGNARLPSSIAPRSACLLLV
jgi:hypothetical protein